MDEIGWKHNPKFSGLHSTKVDMTPYNKSRPAMDRRVLQYYSVIGPMPLLKDDPNLHACAHLYSSDRNSLFGITDLLGKGNEFTQMASIAHSVTFHVNSTDMKCIDESAESKEKRWFCQEAWMARNGVGRTLHESRIWDDQGLHIATTTQDGLVRYGTGKPEKMRQDFENLIKQRRAKGRL